MHELRFPKALRPGDLIAVTAPSSGVEAALHPRLDRALDALRQRGYRVVEGECLRAERLNMSAPAAQRAAELMGFLRDPAVAAVMPPWGGERAIELLPLIDFEALAALPPKWLVGFSDLSTLQLPLLTRAGWASLHGPNLMELGAAEIHPVTAAIWDVLAAPPGALLSQSASAQFQLAGTDWREDPAANLQPTEATRWQRLDGLAAPLHFSGRLIGGCLDTLARLAGTAYGDVPGFVRRCGEEGSLLYLENCEMKPCELLRALCSLRLHGWFEGLSGLLIGRNGVDEGAAGEGLDHLGALRAALEGTGVPVLYDLDIGHRPPQLSLVNGAWARVSLRDGAGSLQQRLGLADPV